jgi:hypothetical protein
MTCSAHRGPILITPRVTLVRPKTSSYRGSHSFDIEIWAFTLDRGGKPILGARVRGGGSAMPSRGFDPMEIRYSATFSCEKGIQLCYAA